MQCYALTFDKRRCLTETNGAAYFCAEHASSAARLTDLPRSSTGLGMLLARVRGALETNSADGGKYTVPGWLQDAPTPLVIEHLKTDPDSMVRWMAAFVLRKRRSQETIEPLWDVLKNDSIRYVRQQCAVALGKIGTPLVLTPLIEALNHDRDQGVRQACAIALGNLGLPQAMEEVALVLEREDNIFVKWDCIVALGQLGDKRVEKLLVRLQAEEIAQVIRDACRDSLQEIRQRNRAMVG